MKGAIVFLTVFILLLVITVAYPDLPPGKQLYDMLGVQTTDPPPAVLGIPITTLVMAIFNGLVYGVIAWLIYTFAARARKPKKPKT